MKPRPKRGFVVPSRGPFQKLTGYGKMEDNYDKNNQELSRVFAFV